MSQPDIETVLHEISPEHAQFFADRLNPEPLDSELADRVFVEKDWTVLKHPLVFSVPYVPALNKSLNQMFKQKTEALDRAIASGSWETYVWLHERPYRVDAFCEILDTLDDTQYWELLAHIWIDSENIRENQETWEILLSSNRGSKHAFIGNIEGLAALPDEFTIYQGHTLDRDDGWSWTLDEPTALWFARRFGLLEDATPIVTIATVRKSDVLAYREDRNEHEIIVSPDLVNIIRTYAPGEENQ